MVGVVSLNKFGAKVVLNLACAFLYDISENQKVQSALAKIIIYCIKNRHEINGMLEACISRVKELLFENKVKIYQKIYRDVTNYSNKHGQ